MLIRPLCVASLYLLLANLLLAPPATADLIGLPEVIIVDNSAGGEELDGFVTQDLFISFQGEYTGSQILTDLTSGSIYQNEFGRDTPPSAVETSSIPALAFDSFTANGSPLTPGPFGDPNRNGAAVDLGGIGDFTWTENELNAAWGPSGDQNVVNQTQFLTARISLSSDASGSFRYLASVDDQRHIFEGFIQNGQMTVVPEPSPWPMLSLIPAILASVGWLRKNLPCSRSTPVSG
jgi:hypothetical protein